jgi:uncharacterized coiled-coil protein SlyX
MTRAVLIVCLLASIILNGWLYSERAGIAYLKADHALQARMIDQLDGVIATKDKQIKMKNKLIQQLVERVK